MHPQLPAKILTMGSALYHWQDAKKVDYAVMIYPVSRDVDVYGDTIRVNLLRDAAQEVDELDFFSMEVSTRI